MSQARYVHIVDDVPELEGLEQGPVLVVCLDGFLDAGSASELAMAAVTADGQGRVVASFEVDEFFDYRARRPPMSFVEDHYTDYDAPRLVVRLCQDAGGSPFLALTGPEPDIRWEAFAEAVRRVVQHFGVRLVVSLGAVPMAVPHTRPVQVTNHATSRRLLIEENVWRGELRIPSSAVAMLELRLGEWGVDACGFVAHIPHYVAQFQYPDAAIALIERVSRVTGLHWQVGELASAGEEKRAEIAAQVEESAEIRQVVTGLEQQYDAFHRALERDEDLLAGDGEIPTGEELGAQFEQFLADLDQPEDD
jgi:predicted ATP-grasp superfamily ATP-dependent carboligase